MFNHVERHEKSLSTRNSSWQVIYLGCYLTLKFVLSVVHIAFRLLFGQD